jgi:catechol 2,3-dioxygenase-like lactoylglutathione lyase family enzyme
MASTASPAAPGTPEFSDQQQADTPAPARQPAASGAAAGPEPGAVPGGGMRLMSVVLYVFELERSVAFYQKLLGLKLTVESAGAALLTGGDGSQLYLRSVGPRAPHTTGGIGIQCSVWTAPSEAELQRCEKVLKELNAHTTTHVAEEFSWVEGRDPNGVPVMVSHPGPGKAIRHQIISRIYAW